MELKLVENGCWETYSAAKIKSAFYATNHFVFPKGNDKYMNEVNREGRLFKTFNGKKFSKQPIGIRTICKVPQIVVSSWYFWKLNRTLFQNCATILAEPGATTTQL